MLLQGAAKRRRSACCPVTGSASCWRPRSCRGLRRRRPPNRSPAAAGCLARTRRKTAPSPGWCFVSGLGLGSKEHRASRR